MRSGQLRISRAKPRKLAIPDVDDDAAAADEARPLYRAWHAEQLPRLYGRYDASRGIDRGAGTRSSGRRRDFARLSAWRCVPQAASGFARLGNLSLRLGPEEAAREIGRASCRERVCQYV